LARINFEDEIFADPRFHDLVLKVGGFNEAVGRLLLFWRAAQRQWIKGKLIHPEEMRPEWEAIIEVKLAERRPEGVYAKGSEEQFSWYLDGIEQRREAGRHSAEVRKKKFGTAQPAGGKQDWGKETIERPSNGVRTGSNGIEPSSSSSSSSSLRKELIHDRKRKSQKPKPQPLAGAREFLEDVYRDHYPRKEGKQEGLERALKQCTKIEDLQLFKAAVLRYAAAKKGEEVRYLKHFSSFVSVWREWTDPTTGTTGRQSQKVIILGD